MRVAYDARVRGWARSRVLRWVRKRVQCWVRARSHGAFPKAQDTGAFLMTGARAGAYVRSL